MQLIFSRARVILIRCKEAFCYVSNNYYLCVIKIETMKVNERIEALRGLFKQQGIKAFIIPSTDPHISEYVAPHWEARQWISGFTGSAGTVVVTDTEAGLWTDSRYFLQAADQLQDSGIELYKEKLPKTPTIAAFLKAKLKAGDVVGIDGLVFGYASAISLKKDLANAGIELKDAGDLIANCWLDRPSIPQNPVFIQSLRFAGKSITDKLSTIRQELGQFRQLGSNNGVVTEMGILVPALDEIAWALNLRGNDIHCNPVFISYLLISESEAHLFILPEKVTDEVNVYLAETGITLHNYNDFIPFLKQLAHKRIVLNPAQTNFAAYQAIKSACEVIEKTPSPIALLKAVRNEAEIENLHNVMIKDGVAMVKFLRWIDTEADIYHETEMSVDRQLHAFRAAQPDYIGESFDTIAGYGPHGAIVHYEATPETDVSLEKKGFLLLDSGAQYLDGTTDITRTIPLGYLTPEEKEDYTLILKGHIDLAMAVFPENTRGSQIDILARQPIWKHRMNYLHGTGHGVGAFLNVHEGPHSVRMEENPVTLQAGMTVTDEPGIYKAGSHGVRTENILLVVPAGEGMFGSYLKFETVTLCPIDKRPIIKELLSAEEIDWLNQYHQKVYDLLSPQLDYDERYWLANATSAL